MELFLWVLSGDQHFSVIEGEEFKRLVTTWNLELLIPRRRTITSQSRGPKGHDKLRVMDMIELLAGIDSMTADSCSSILCRASMTRKAHWIVYDSKLKKTLLKFPKNPYSTYK